MDRLVVESVSALVDPQPGERILDIGCGEGNHLLLFNSLGLNTSGVDASPYMIRRARKRLGERTTLKEGRAEELPFDDNEVELAVLINTLEFLDDPLSAMKEAGRVARRGVFIAAMNSLSWHCLFAKAQGLLRESLFDRITLYNLWELRSYARKAYGDVPMAWRSSGMGRAFIEKFFSRLLMGGSPDHYPFGPFLGVYVTMRYWVMSEQHPLKVGLKEAAPSILGGATMGRSECIDGRSEFTGAHNKF